jgi:hypothetical protein
MNEPFRGKSMQDTGRRPHKVSGEFFRMHIAPRVTVIEEYDDDESTAQHFRGTARVESDIPVRP